MISLFRNLIGKIFGDVTNISTANNKLTQIGGSGNSQQSTSGDNSPIINNQGPDRNDPQEFKYFKQDLENQKYEFIDSISCPFSIAVGPEGQLVICNYSNKWKVLSDETIGVNDISLMFVINEFSDDSSEEVKMIIRTALDLSDTKIQNHKEKQNKIYLN